jgi:hypothetical protein
LFSYWIDAPSPRAIPWMSVRVNLPRAGKDSGAVDVPQ